MFKSKFKLKILINYFLFAANICFIICANVVDSSQSTAYSMLCIQDSVPIAISKLIQILELIASASIYIQVLLHKKTVCRIEKHLQTVDLLFSKLNIRFSYQKYNIVIKLSLVITVILIMAVYTILCLHYGLVSAAEIILRFVTSFHPIILIYLMTLLDVYLCWLVRIKLCALSMLLSELCEFKHPDENISNWKVKFVQENPKMFFTDLIKISEIYEILYETIDKLNSAFGLFCLSSIGRHFGIYS